MRGHEFFILHFFISPRNALAFLPLCVNLFVSKTKIWNSRWYKF